MITLGRSDAILAADIIKLYLEEQRIRFEFLNEDDEAYDDEVRNLLEFIEVQLDSMSRSS